MRGQQAKEQGLLATELHLPPPLHPHLIGSHLLSQSAASISPFTLSHSKLLPALVMNVITHWTNQSIYPPPLLINSLSLCRANLKEWIQQLGVTPMKLSYIFPQQMLLERLRSGKLLLASRHCWESWHQNRPPTSSCLRWNSPQRLWQRKGLKPSALPRGTDAEAQVEHIPESRKWPSKRDGKRGGQSFVGENCVFQMAWTLTHSRHALQICFINNSNSTDIYCVPGMYLNSFEAGSLYHPAPKWQRWNPHSDPALLFYYITTAPVDLSGFKEKVNSTHTPWVPEQQGNTPAPEATAGRGAVVPTSLRGKD